MLEARQNAGNPVQRLTEFLKAVLLFTGVVDCLEEQEKMGFYYTTAHVRGTGKFTGRIARLLIKNETMLLLVDDQVKAIFPDLVCMLDPDTARGVMSAELSPGAPVALVGARCHQRLRDALATTAGSRAFSPSRYGYPALNWRPLEELAEGFR